MTSVIHDTVIVTADDGDTVHYGAAIAVDGRQIAATGMRFLMAERAYDRIGTEIGDPAPFQLDRKLGEGHMVNIEQLHGKWNGKADGRVRVAISAWAPDMCSPELLRDLSALQKKLG